MTRFRSMAVAQTCPVKGDVQANLDEHIRLARLAAAAGWLSLRRAGPGGAAFRDAGRHSVAVRVNKDDLPQLADGHGFFGAAAFLAVFFDAVLAFFLSLP
jgi:hypothetical protein